MFKKLFSGFMTATILAGIVPYSVVASGSLTLDSYNITTSAVILNFDGIGNGACISDTGLEDKIVLEKYSKNGKVEQITDFEVIVQSEDVSGKDGSGTDIVSAKADSLIIKPEEGISDEALYRVTSRAGIADSSGNSLTNSVDTGWIAVEVLVSDDFTITKDSNGNPQYPYSLLPNQTNKYASAYWNLSSTNAQPRIQSNALQFGNNPGYAWISETGLPTSERVRDFTIEYDVIPPSRQNNRAPSLVLRTGEPASSNYDWNIRSGWCIDLGAVTSTTKMGTVNFSVQRTKTVTSEEFTYSGNLMRIRASAIGSNLQFYIDDKKYIDVIETTKNIANGIFGFGGSDYGGYSGCTVFDNVVVTKMIEYGEELPTLTVEDVYTQETDVVVKFSQILDEDYVVDFVTLKKDGREVDIMVDVTYDIVRITSDEQLVDGEYVLMLNKGIAAENVAVLAKPYQAVLTVSGETYSLEPVVAPEITNLQTELSEDELELSFDYSGGNANNSMYYIYSSLTEAGEYEEIDSGRLTDDNISIPAGDEYDNCYLKVKIIPEDIKGFVNDEIETESFKGRFSPEIKSVTIEDAFDDGYVEVADYEFYDENGDENFSEIFWYVSDEPEGEYTVITGENENRLQVDSLSDKFIKVYIMPKTDVYPYTGEMYKSDFYCRTYPPEARDVKIDGEATLNTELKGKYEYYDINRNEEAGSTFRWLISDNADSGFEVAKDSEGRDITSDTFTITRDHIGKYVIFEVIPKKATKPGEPHRSAPFALPARPIAKNVGVSGTIRAGYTVYGVYDYYQVSNVEEGDSEYIWYVNGEIVSRQKQYTISTRDAGKKLVFEVIPVSEKDPFEGEPVKSAEKNIASSGKLSSSGSSSGGSSSGGIKVPTVSGKDEGQASKNKFADIANSRYKAEIIDLTNKGIIKGISETEFAPLKNITRAEFATLVVRMLGINVTAYQGIFDDVEQNAWYANNVQAAFNSGLIEGYAGNFRPQDGITVEEIIKILVSAYEAKNSKIEGKEVNYSNVSDWATEFVSKAAKVGFITNDTEFVINSSATREQAAALVSRFVKKGGVK